MTHYTQTKHFIAEAWQSFAEAIDTFKWIWHELLPPEGRRHALYALALMLLGMLISMEVVNSLNQLITAIGQGGQSEAYNQIIQIGLFWIIARLVLAWQSAHREWAWNHNTLHIPVRLSELQFRKTHGELKSAETGVSPEQIEILKDKVANIQYAVLFEGSEAVAILLSSLVYITLNDWVVGLIVTGLIVINMVFFFLVNHYFSGRIKEIDERWRKAQAWTSERWVQFSQVKVTGTEQFVQRTIYEKLKAVLDPDFILWGRDFQIVDLFRSFANIGVMVAVLLYGLSANWEAGLYAAMYLWLNFVKDQLWRIGSLQRHLIENTERASGIKAKLIIPSESHYAEGDDFILEEDDEELDQIRTT